MRESIIDYRDVTLPRLPCPDLPGYQGDLDDLRFLFRKLSIRSVDDIQQIIDKYYPDDVITPEHRLLLETILEEVNV